MPNRRQVDLRRKAQDRRLKAKGIRVNEDFSYFAFLGYHLNAEQFEVKVKPFVVSCESVEQSNHERLNRSPFDRLRANG